MATSAVFEALVAIRSVLDWKPSWLSLIGTQYLQHYVYICVCSVMKFKFQEVIEIKRNATSSQSKCMSNNIKNTLEE